MTYILPLKTTPSTIEGMGSQKPINLSLESYTVQLISVDLQNCKYGPHQPKAMSTNAGKVVAKDARMKREQTLGGLGK